MEIVRPEVVFVLTAALLGFWFCLAVGGRGREDAWQEAARRLGGRLYARGGDHRIILPWRGVDATLTEKPRLSFEVPLRGFTAPRFDVGTPQERGTCDAAGKDFQVGPARPLLEELNGWSIETCEMGEVFRVVAGPANRRERDVLAFARLCLRIAELARLHAPTPGVTVLGEGTVHETECQVCGGAMVVELVRCARCRTPHHDDCWSYAGRCSTYGCGSRERA
jgi:hypothetical protein